MTSRRGTRSQVTALRTMVAAGLVALALLPTVLAGTSAAAPTAGPQPPSPDTPAQQARDEAERILAQDEYQGPGENKSLLERIQDWIADRLPERRGGDGVRIPDAVPVVVSIVAIIVVVALVARGLANGRRRTKADPDEPDEGDVEITPLRSADEWATEAARFEAAGQWRDAVRARYRGLVARLIERNLVTDVPGRTPGEHVADLTRTAPGASAAFAQVVSTYQHAWFGEDAATSSEATAVRDGATQVLEQAGKGPKAATAAPDPLAPDTLRPDPGRPDPEPQR